VSLRPTERFARLRLARADRVGPVSFRQLLERFGSAERALEALPDLDRIGARLIVLGEADYPRMLGALDPPPPLVWTRGDASLLARESVGVVGARIASAGGQRIARGLAQALGEAGFAVTSGLARGIDAAAHAGSLETGTVAVLGGGVDDVYPSDNAALYAQIVERGCVVSESPIGTRAQARDFPRRNRIISGLSRGVIVVEAELRSGSLITARLANEQGRDVFAVPGSPLDPRSRGPNDLLRNGAILSEPPSYGLTDMPDDIDAALIEQVAALLSPVPTPRDELARALNLPVGPVAAALLELSLAGRATLLPGGLAST
jgi:DNA processing protein